jgi:predicted nucleic acid-binding protein
VAAYSVLYDACVLYSAPLRDLLLRLATVDLFRARWTETILDECFRNLASNRPDLQLTQLARTRELMNAHVLDALITGYETLIPSLTLPDPTDRHVLAAAITGGVDAIITYNLTDFPMQALKVFGIEAQHPDEFIACQLDLGPARVLTALREQRAALKRSPRTLDEFLATLEQQRLVQTVARLRRDHYTDLL